MIRQVCSCGKSYQLNDDMIGRKVKCPACQAVFTVVPQAELVVQAELVPIDTLPPAAAPLGAANTQGPLQGFGPASSPLGTPWAAPGPAAYLPKGQFASAPAPAPTRVYPWWLWVAAGIGAVGSLLLVVAVIVQMNRPNSGNLATDIPTTPPYMPDGPPISVDEIEVGPFPPKGSTVGADFGNWQIYTSETGGYSINLPGKPQISPQAVESPLGRIDGNEIEIGGRSAGVLVTVSHTDFPFDAGKLSLDHIIETTVQRHQGRVTRAIDVQISGRPGREFSVEFALIGAAESKGLYRALSVSGRIYTLGYAAPVERFDEPAARKCLDSFTITKEPPSTESTYAPLVAGPGVPLQRQVAWVTHESKSGGFKVEMPATPTNVSSHLAIPRNRYAEAIASEVQGKGAFVVAANRHGRPILPEGLPSFLESLRLGMSSKGKVVSQTNSTQGNFSVYDFTLDAPGGSRHLIRYYISTEWYYDVAWFGPAPEAASEETKRFFASFTLLAPEGSP